MKEVASNSRSVLPPNMPSHGLHVCLGVAIKIPIVCVVLEGGPGTLHVSRSCCASWGSGPVVEEGLVDASAKNLAPSLGTHMACCPQYMEGREATTGQGCFQVGKDTPNG